MQGQDENKGFKPSGLIAKLIIRFGTAPTRLLVRLLADERKRRHFNDFLPRDQEQSQSSERQRLIILSTALNLVLVGAIGMVVYDCYKAYEWGHFRSSFKAGRYLDLLVFSPSWKPTLAVLSCVTALLVEFFAFSFPGSRYAKMVKYLRIGGLLKEDGEDANLDDFWYYPGKTLTLRPPSGQLGEEIVKREGMWRDADFMPNPEPVVLEHANKYVFTGAAKKVFSTFFYDHEEEWNQSLQDIEARYKWFLGENVYQRGLLLKDCFEEFSQLFLGMSGSGKTEAMKCALSWFLCKHPTARLVIVDMKGTADWDVFAPFVEPGRIVKDGDEALPAIMYFYQLFLKRQAYMKEKGYKNIKVWAEREEVDVPPAVLVVDEWPQLVEKLQWDRNYQKEGTPANTLFKLYTMGRSYGLWVILGSQMGNFSILPSDINKNLKVRVIFRVGTEGESVNWIGSEKAFRLGKNSRRPDGAHDGQQGYAYVDSDKGAVRFWYMDEWLLVHELIKHRVLPMKGSSYSIPHKMGLPLVLKEKLKAYGGNESKLNAFNRAELKSFKEAMARYEASYKKLEQTVMKELGEGKPSLGEIWNPGETMEQYLQRVMPDAAPAPTPARGGMGGRFGSSLWDDEPRAPLAPPPAIAQAPEKKTSPKPRAFESIEDEDPTAKVDAIIEKRIREREKLIAKESGGETEKPKTRSRRDPATPSKKKKLD